MSLLESFRKLFSKKEDETEKRRQEIEHSLHAKIKKEKEKYRESTMKKLSIEDIDKKNEEAKEKEMRELIEKKRRKQEKEDMAKKRNKTLSTNF
jgi:hypothetical protein